MVASNFILIFLSARLCCVCINVERARRTCDINGQWSLGNKTDYDACVKSLLEHLQASSDGGPFILYPTFSPYDVFSQPWTSSESELHEEIKVTTQQQNIFIIMSTRTNRNFALCSNWIKSRSRCCHALT